ncbi:MAG: hypothetical protein DYG89_05400 [Caldilinea sp. CFX5]|nr:hypothetical protein [Caldilinea sp. CFX5]
MKTLLKHYWYSVVLCLSFFWVMALGQPVFAGDVTIGGTVTDEQTGAPLNAVNVEFYRQAEPGSTWWPPTGRVRTDASGIYTATNLEAGVYRIAFWEDASPHYYLAEYYNNIDSSNFGSATPLTVTAGTMITNMNAQLVRGGEITGVVTNGDGAPLMNIGINVQRKVLLPGGGEQLESFTSASTDASGQYHITAMPAGSYRIGFTDQNWPRQYVDEIYDNAPDWSSATDIAVQEGTVSANHNARLDHLGAITGAITDHNGNPIAAGVTIGLFQRMNPGSHSYWQQSSHSTVVQADGAYQLRGLSPGAYRVYFYDVNWPRFYATQFYANALSLESAQTVTVTANLTVTGINAQMATTGRITGTVTDRAGSPLADIRVTAEKFNPTTEGGSWMFMAQYLSNSQGVYAIPGLEPGIYRLQFQDSRSPTFYYPATLPTTVTVTLATTIANVDMALDTKGIIAGAVTDDQGAALTDITALLEYPLPDYPDVWWVWGAVQTDETGHYRFQALDERRYRLLFKDERSPRQYATEYFNNMPNAEDATVLTVVSNTVMTNIDAQLTTLGKVAGLVTDAANQPLAQIQVTLYQAADGNWHPTNFAVTTDETGRYSLEGMDAGSYRLGFSDTRSPAEYVSEFYDDHPLATATDITISNGVTVTANAQLDAKGRISGLITDLQGQPLADIQAAANYRAPDSEQWEVAGYFNTDATGRFTLGGLDERAYRICFYDVSNQYRYSHECYDDAPSIQRAKDVTVTAGATLTIDVALAPTGGISGVITDEAGNPLPWIQAQLWSDPQGNGQWMLDPIHWTYSDDNGAYGLTGLDAGTYRMRFAVIGGTVYAPEFYNNAVFLEEASDVIVMPGQITPDINAQMGPYSHITGTVTGANGEPLTTTIRVAAVQLRPDPLGYDYWEIVSIAETDSEGRYNLTGLIKGTYRIWFYDAYTNYYHEEYYDNQGYPDHGADIQVGVAMTVTDINAQLVPYDALNFPPLARNDYLFVYEGGMTTTVGYHDPSLLVNDRDDKTMTLELTATLVTSPTHGTIMLNRDGTFTYTHNADGATIDYFTYKVNDGVYDSNVATVTVAITQTNDAPLAVNDSYTLTTGTTLTGSNVLANDSDEEGDVLTATLVISPAHGALTLAAHGLFTYTHDGSATLTDTFTYRAGDGITTSTVATVNLIISPTTPLVSFALSKTVGIDGIKPLCTAKEEMKVPVGTAVVYCYTIRNTGSTTLTTHSLVDSDLGQLLDNVTYALAPGAAYSVTFTKTLTVSITNVATWTATIADVGQSIQRAIPGATGSTGAAATVLISGPTDDQDGDTIPDNLEGWGDPDGDNIPNFLDTNADGDSKSDQEEVGDPANPTDSDNDGIPDFLDNDGSLPGLNLKQFLPLIHK